VHGSSYGSFWKACVNHIQVNQDILTITISEWMKDWYYNQTSITFTVKLKKNKKDLDSIDNKFKRHLIQGGPSQSFVSQIKQVNINQTKLWLKKKLESMLFWIYIYIDIYIYARVFPGQVLNVFIDFSLSGKDTV
jgi:hypothetical protein